MKTDQRTFEKAALGNIKDFESLIQQYERLLYSIAYQMLGNPQDAQDVTQEAFLKIYQHLSGCRNAASFKSWACAIVNNACIDELRKRKNRTADSLDETLFIDEDKLSHQIKDPGATPEDALIRNETILEVRRAVDELPEEYKILIILRDMQDFSYAELAETLDLNLGLVKSRLFRARVLLKKILLEQNKK